MWQKRPGRANSSFLTNINNLLFYSKPYQPEKTCLNSLTCLNGNLHKFWQSYSGVLTSYITPSVCIYMQLWNLFIISPPLFFLVLQNLLQGFLQISVDPLKRQHGFSSAACLSRYLSTEGTILQCKSGPAVHTSGVRWKSFSPRLESLTGSQTVWKAHTMRPKNLKSIF